MHGHAGLGTRLGENSTNSLVNPYSHLMCIARVRLSVKDYIHEASKVWCQKYTKWLCLLLEWELGCFFLGLGLFVEDESTDLSRTCITCIKYTSCCRFAVDFFHCRLNEDSVRERDWYEAREREEVVRKQRERKAADIKAKQQLIKQIADDRK